MSIIDRARIIRHQIEHMAENLSDETALDYKELYPQWITDHAYSIGDRVRDEDVLYKCVQSHTSQADWQPHLTPALWVVVSIEEWPEWVQPIGAQDAYMLGDKVSHLEKHWVSTMDYNVYEPSVYGWDEVI